MGDQGTRIGTGEASFGAETQTWEHSTVSEQDGIIRIRVTPEPTPEEMAVISTVVAGLVALPAAADRDVSPSSVDGRERWREAGRREMLRSSDPEDW